MEKNFLSKNSASVKFPVSASAIRRHRDRQTPRVLGMGISDYPKKDPLRAVPAELSLVTEQLGQGEKFINRQFTFENLYAQSQSNDYNIIHLATHADFQSGQSEETYIQLWSERMGLDRFRELQWHENAALDLLVLSACRTALGDLRSELGFGGLALQSGVRSVLASLWNVHDFGHFCIDGGILHPLK
jgi:CHAT domain-containing protein